MVAECNHMWSMRQMMWYETDGSYKMIRVSHCDKCGKVEINEA